jgi:hypothetical protein
MAEPGSSPWAAASTAPAVGWHKRDGDYGGLLRVTKDVASHFLGDRAHDLLGDGEAMAV